MTPVLCTFEATFLRPALQNFEAFQLRAMSKFPWLNFTLHPATDLIFLIYQRGELAGLDAEAQNVFAAQLRAIPAATDVVLICLAEEIPLTAKLDAICLEREAQVLHSIAKFSNVKILDGRILERMLQPVSSQSDQYRYLAAAAYTPDLFLSLAGWMNQLRNFKRGVSKKLLIFDLDHTLWHGELAEDGAGGIDETWDSAEGRAFLDLQAVMLHAKSMGYVLAICSRNSLDDVRAYLQSSQFLKFRESDFALISASWEPKSKQIQKLLEALRVLPESAIFFDNDSRERDLVRTSFAALEVPDLNRNPSLRPAQVLGVIGIENPFATELDQARNSSFAHASDRLMPIDDENSVLAWVQSLHIELTALKPDDSTWPRIVQLSNKTNQFNFHPRTRSLGEWQEFASGPRRQVFAFRYRDRLGDDGIVAIAALEISSNTAVLHDFILSCRAFGRGIEQAVLQFIGELAVEKGCERIECRFVKGARNLVAQDFVAGLSARWLDDRTFEISAESHGLKSSLTINNLNLT